MKIPTPIIKFLDWFPNQHVAFLSCAIFVIGLIAGRALMSIGMIMLLGNSLLDKNLLETVQRFIKNRAALLLTGLFLLFVLSFFWSQNTNYFWGRIVLMFPFVGMPFAFQAIKWERKWFDNLAVLFILVCLAGVGWSLFQYLQDKEAIDLAYGVSHSLPTPFGGDHIRFGVAIVIAVSFCLQLFKQKIKGHWIILGIIVFFSIYLHILAGKTALLSLYLLFLYEIVVLIIRRNKIAWGLGLLSLLFVLPIIFYFTSDSFKNKINYTRYSFGQFFNETEETNISDEGRIVSYKTGLEVFKNNWLLGVGVGDGQDAMQAAYEKNNIQTVKILYPHNQFLYLALVLGLLGFCYFLYFFIYLFTRYFGTATWLSMLLLIFVVPFLVEAFLNTQYGIALFVFFFLLLERRQSVE